MNVNMYTYIYIQYVYIHIYIYIYICIYLRGACAPNPATEPDTHTVKEGRDCTSLVQRLAGLRENACDNL